MVSFFTNIEPKLNVGLNLSHMRDTMLVGLNLSRSHGQKITVSKLVHHRKEEELDPT